MLRTHRPTADPHRAAPRGTDRHGIDPSGYGRHGTQVADRTRPGAHEGSGGQRGTSKPRSTESKG